MKKSGLNYTAYRLIVVRFGILPVQEQCLGATHLGKQMWWSMACNLLQCILIGVMLWWSMACHLRQSILVGCVLLWSMACHFRQCILGRLVLLWSMAWLSWQCILIGLMLWWSMARQFRQSILARLMLWWSMTCHFRQCILVGPIHRVPMRKILLFLLLSSSCRPSSNISHTAGDFEGAYPQTIHKLSTNSIHKPQVMVKTTSLSLWMGVV